MKIPLVGIHKTLDLVIGLSLLFLLLGFFVALIPYSSLDLQITRSLQGITNPFFSQIMSWVSLVGFNPYIEITIFTFFLLLYSSGLRLGAFIAIASAASSAILGSLIKILFDRSRPDPSLVHVIGELADKSFPSNHVLIYTTFFGFLFYLSRYSIKNTFARFVLSTISLFLLLTVGFSRIYLGAHWASDVLGGYLLGAACLAITIRLYRIIESNVKR